MVITRLLIWQLVCPGKAIIELYDAEDGKVIFVVKKKTANLLGGFCCRDGGI